MAVKASQTRHKAVEAALDEAGKSTVDKGEVLCEVTMKLWSNAPADVVFTPVGVECMTGHLLGRIRNDLVRAYRLQRRSSHLVSKE